MKHIMKWVLVGLLTVAIDGCSNKDDDTSKKKEIKSISHLKKTGQTEAYLKYDDGYYQKGIKPNYSRDDSKQIVTDHISGLEWQDNGEAGSLKKNWPDAKAYCSKLSLDGGGWRLPTVDELVYIVDKSKYWPSIDTTFFQLVVPDRYWSSTTIVDRGDKAWTVSFKGGTSGWRNKYKSLHLRCVRAKH